MSVLERRGDLPVDVFEAIGDLISRFEGEKFVGKIDYNYSSQMLPGIHSKRFTVHYDTLSRAGDKLQGEPESEFEIIGGEIAIDPNNSTRYLAVVYAHTSLEIYSPIIAFYATNELKFKNNVNEIRWL